MRRTRNQVRATSDDTRRRGVSLRPASPGNNASLAEASPPAFRAACTPAPTTYRKPIARTRPGYESPASNGLSASVRIAESSLQRARYSPDSPIFNVPLSRAAMTQLMIGRSRIGERKSSLSPDDLSLSLPSSSLLSVATRETCARQRVQARRCVSDVVHVPVALRATRPVRGVGHRAHIRAATRTRDLCHCEACSGRVYRRSRSARSMTADACRLPPADRYLASRFTRVAPT